jgi:excisionase family DNA binding protein
MEKTTDTLMMSKEAAEYLMMEVETLRRYCRKRQIAYYDMPGGFQFRKADLDSFRASRLMTPAEA